VRFLIEREFWKIRRGRLKKKNARGVSGEHSFYLRRVVSAGDGASIPNLSGRINVSKTAELIRIGKDNRDRASMTVGYAEPEARSTKPSSSRWAAALAVSERADLLAESADATRCKRVDRRSARMRNTARSALMFARAG